MSSALDFWSRRKAQVRQEDEAERRAATEAAARAEAETLEQKPDDEILAELGLPDPDTLCRGDDFSAFLAKGVPERLRRRALRRLWVSNPTLACLDGLNDYDSDFTDAATCVDVLKTAYKVGRGFLPDPEPEAGPAAPDTAHAGASEPVVEPAPAPSVRPPESPARATRPVLAAETDAAEAPQGSSGDADPDHDTPRATRRMRFTFAGDTA